MPNPSVDLTEIVEQAKQVEEQAQQEKDITVPRMVEFNIEYTDEYGQKRATTVTSQVMTGAEKRAADRTAAMLAGTKWEWLPDDAKLRFQALATVEIQLRDAPAWLKEAYKEDDELLLSLYEMCRAHEYSFRGLIDGEGETAKKRVVVSSDVLDSFFDKHAS